jgi:hypothetical protein
VERSYSTTVERPRGFPWGDRLPATEVSALYRVFLGTMALEGAVEDGLVRVQGLPPWSERSPDGSGWSAPPASGPVLPFRWRLPAPAGRGSLSNWSAHRGSAPRVVRGRLPRRSGTPLLVPRSVRRSSRRVGADPVGAPL